MTKEEFLGAWKIKYPAKTTIADGGASSLYATKGSKYLRLTCPYCAKTKLGQDTNHHLNAHYEQGWFKCQRCGESGTTDWLLGKWKGSPKPKEAWKEYKSSQENQKVDPALLARSRGLEATRVKPGICIPLQELKRSEPAWQYLLAEGFSQPKLLELAETYGIHVCVQGRQFTSKPENTTTGRLIFEIREGRTLFGWQARWLPAQWPPTEDDRRMSARVQKYLISPGLKKSHILYNWTIAQKYDMWVVVEGIKKVWKTGPFALATFGVGNNPSPPEECSAEAYNEFWSVRLKRGNRPVVLLYDKGAWKQARLHAAQLAEMGVEAIPAALPENGADDLDNYMTQEILQIIKNAAGRLPKRIA